MKKLILLLLSFTLSFAVYSQNSTTFDKEIPSDRVSFEYRGKAIDTVSANKTSFSYSFLNTGQIENKESFTNYWEIALDSISGTPAAVKVEFQRRKNIFTTWSTDSTVYFYGSQSDTTIVYYDTNAKPDPYRKVNVTYGDGFKIKIDWFSVLFLKE